MGYNKLYLHQPVLDKLEGTIVVGACLLCFNRFKNKLGGCSQAWNNPTLVCGGLEALLTNCRWHLKGVEKNYLKEVHR